MPVSQSVDLMHRKSAPENSQCMCKRFFESHSQVEEKTSRNVQQILKSQFLSSVLDSAFSKWSGTIMFYLGGDVLYAKGNFL